MTNEEFIESIRLEREEWRTIPEWERYLVSSFGRIASKNAPYEHQGKTYTKKAALLHPTKAGGRVPYLTVMLSDGHGFVRRRSIHRLVASAFIPNPMNLPQINHKDENSLNNHAENLEWCDQKYNNAYGTCKERSAKTLRFTQSNRRKVVLLDKDSNFVASYDSISFAHDATGVPRTTIRGACISKRLVYGTQRWLYYEDYESLISQ